MSWLWGGKSVGVDGEEVPGVDGAVLVVVEGMEGGLDQSMTLRVVHACKRQQKGESCMSSVGGLLLFIVGKRRKKKGEGEKGKERRRRNKMKGP